MTLSPKTALLASALALTLMPIAAFAHGDDDKPHQVQTFDNTGFESIKVVGVFKLDVKVGEDFGISISGHEDEMDDLKVEVVKGELRLDKTKRRNMKSKNGVQATITMPDLSGLSVQGVATGDIEGIDADDFELYISGVGELNLAGRCEHLTAAVSGVGEVSAEDFKCEDVHVSLSGVGEAKVYASESIDVKASGIGSVDVWGSPKDVTKSKGFMSSIKIR